MSSQPTIRRGNPTGINSATKLCQGRLNAKGFGPLTADGDFGARTEQAVEQFQAANGLTADGIVGPMTWTLLMSEGQAVTPTAVITGARTALRSKIPGDAPAPAKAVLQAAIDRLGDREVPDGSNGGPEIADIVEWDGGDGKAPSAYYLHWGVTDKATLQSMPAWCVLLTCYAFRHGLRVADWKSIPYGNWLGGVAQVEAWAQKAGKWTAGAGGGQAFPAGALFTISRGQSGSDPAASAQAGHIGFVVCDNGDGTIMTVEGNVSNAVGSHRREKSTLRGYIVWW